MSSLPPRPPGDLGLPDPADAGPLTDSELAEVRALLAAPARRVPAERGALSRAGASGAFPIIMCISLALDMALTVVVAFLLAHYSTTTTTLGTVIAAQHQSSVSACQAANINRTEDKAVWAFVISSFSSPKETAATRMVLNHVGALVDQKDALHNCVKQYSNGS